jgi:hypothetical protein
MALVINSYPRPICKVYKVINMAMLNLGFCSSHICGASAGTLLPMFQDKVSALRVKFDLRRWDRNVGNELPTKHNIPERRRPYLRRQKPKILHAESQLWFTSSALCRQCRQSEVFLWKRKLQFKIWNQNLIHIHFQNIIKIISTCVTWNQQVI